MAKYHFKSFSVCVASLLFFRSSCWSYHNCNLWIQIKCKEINKQIYIYSQHGKIMRTGIACKKIPCYMRKSACRSFIVKQGKIF